MPAVHSMASGAFIARIHLHKSSYSIQLTDNNNNNIPHPLISITPRSLNLP